MTADPRQTLHFTAPPSHSAAHLQRGLNDARLNDAKLNDARLNDEHIRGVDVEVTPRRR